MDAVKLQTLDQVSDAMDAVEAARAVKGLSDDDKDNLEQTAVSLRNMERSIIKLMQDELVEKLKSDSKDLADLTEKISKSSKKLDKLANILEKTSEAVGLLISAIAGGVSAGILRSVTIPTTKPKKKKKSGTGSPRRGGAR